MRRECAGDIPNAPRSISEKLDLCNIEAHTWGTWEIANETPPKSTRRANQIVSLLPIDRGERVEKRSRATGTHLTNHNQVFTTSNDVDLKMTHPQIAPQNRPPPTSQVLHNNFLRPRTNPRSMVHPKPSAQRPRKLRAQNTRSERTSIRDETKRSLACQEESEAVLPVRRSGPTTRARPYRFRTMCSQPPSQFFALAEHSLMQFAAALLNSVPAFTQ